MLARAQGAGVFAVDVFEGHPRQVVVVVGADLDDRDDVLVAQRTVDAGLVEHALNGFFGALGVLQQLLEHDGAAEIAHTFLARDEDFTHAANGDPLNDDVALQHSRS